jgi:hypothetical protein
MPYNNQRLEKAAVAAFGPKWKRPLAKAMGEHHTQVMRWASGASEISDEKLEMAISRMKELARERINELTKAIGGG